MNARSKEKVCTDITSSGLVHIDETLREDGSCVVLPLTVGEGVDGLELDGVLRFVHAVLTAAFFSAIL